MRRHTPPRRGDALAEPLRQIPGAVGSLETILDRPAGEPRAAVVFAHPLPTEGGTMHTKVVFQAAKALARIGCVVLRFNFRGVGLSAGAWDRGRGEMDDFASAIEYMAATYPDLDLWAAGYSFGSYIAGTVGADDDRVCALIMIAPPVDRYEFASVKLSRRPKFIVHGGRDELISIRMVRHFYAQLHEPKELIEIDGANHLFDGQAAEIGDALVDLLEDFSCRMLSS
jgi:alpha/beta superfamily hydrolase